VLLNFGIESLARSRSLEEKRRNWILVIQLVEAEEHHLVLLYDPYSQE